jgi:hypothetical protein
MANYQQTKNHTFSALREYTPERALPQQTSPSDPNINADLLVGSQSDPAILLE